MEKGKSLQILQFEACFRQTFCGDWLNAEVKKLIDLEIFCRILASAITPIQDLSTKGHPYEPHSVFFRGRSFMYDFRRLSKR